MDRKHSDSPASRNFKLVLMRLLIATYLMACSVGVAPGPSLVPTLSQLMPETQATVLGTIMMFLPSYAMLAGIWLRLSIHVLAMMITLATILDLFVFHAVPKPGLLLHEIVTLCALLQFLMLLKGRHFRRSSLVKRKVSVRRLEPEQRMEPKLPEIAATEPVQGIFSLAATEKKPRKRTAFRDEDDVVNIFAA